MLYGKHVDVRLSETDKQGKPKWTLQDIIQGDSDAPQQLSGLMVASGSAGIDL